jgi:hypothetical protein
MPHRHTCIVRIDAEVGASCAVGVSEAVRNQFFAQPRLFLYEVAPQWGPPQVAAKVFPADLYWGSVFALW